MKLIVLFSLAAFVYGEEEAASEAGLNGRIVGGRPVDISRYGWQISLQKNGRQSCGGTILSNHWVVTAAHCIHKGQNYTVRAGSTKRNEKGFLIEADEIIVHPLYGKDARTDNDVALIHLRKALRLNGRTIRAVKPVAIDEDAPVGSSVTISGWGSLQEGDPLGSQVLQAVDVPIVDWQICKDKYAENESVITKNMICAGANEGGKDSCQGDSGGPLVDAQRNLVGIVSWGAGCGRREFPGVYTRIASPSIRNFIKQYTRI